MAAARVSHLAQVYPGVRLGEGVVIDAFCEIGYPPAGSAPGELETVIGDNTVIRSHVVIYAGTRIGSDCHLGHKANVREHTEIGDRASIGTLSVIEHHVRIAAGVRIHTQVFVPEYSELMEGAWIGPNAVLTNAKYPAFPHTKHHLKGPVVGVGARVGANATLLPGVRLGDGCLVGAGAVVTRDVPPGMVVAGNPARLIRPVADIDLPGAE